MFCFAFDYTNIYDKERDYFIAKTKFQLNGYFGPPQKKFYIRETRNLLTDANSRTDTTFFLGGSVFF